MNNSNTLATIDQVEIAFGSANLKNSNSNDLAIFKFTNKVTTAACFTQNKFIAAPVIVAKEHLKLANNQSQIWVINSGNANCGTGEEGLNTAKKTCKFLADKFNITEELVIPFSTGVIMEKLRWDKLQAGIAGIIDKFTTNAWHEAADAIMTTDTVIKTSSYNDKFKINGIAKGAGMIHPNMATMLAFIVTDVAIAKDQLQTALKLSCDKSFNTISVDGDTSTNDAVIIASTGAEQELNKIELQEFQHALDQVCIDLAQQIVSDGEGTTCIANAFVTGFASDNDCKKIANSIACSPLVKTMIHAKDPNVGRILMAIGKTQLDFDPNKIKIKLNNYLSFNNGTNPTGYNEDEAKKLMNTTTINIEVIANIKSGTNAVVTFSDLSNEYVNINIDKRT